MKVLSVNTYGGSLLLGAKAMGAEIIGSYEDEKAFGTDVQRLNFGGEFPIRAQNPRHWPYDREGNKSSLHGAVVIAHPPCSAFSNQNNSMFRRGTGSDAFRCTTEVLDFAMGCEADAIAIESVMGAKEGARAVHDQYAAKYDYFPYRITLNSVVFGVPQERERFWIIFVRKNILVGTSALPGAVNFKVNIEPKFMRVREITDNTDLEHDRPPEDNVKDFTKQKQKWYKMGVTDDEIDEIMSGKRGYGMVNTKFKGSRFAKDYNLFTFGTRNLRLLDPDGFSTVLLADANWAIPGHGFDLVESHGGRLLTISEYKAFMGFPRDYKFPPKYLGGKFRAYLSKGVCPPVASWILEQIQWNLEGGDKKVVYSIEPNKEAAITVRPLA